MTKDRRGALALYLIFFLSGFPALVYQVVWQRALFSIYGVNIESVTVVVTAFMIGLGVGSLFGGHLSKRPRIAPLAAFAVFELMIAVFGFYSLALFDSVGHRTLGASTFETFSITFGLVLLPTALMGATLPLLVAYLTRRLAHVGRSVGTLYFVNTLGSSAACFVAALFLMERLGLAGSVRAAAILNLLVGLAAVVVHVRDRAPATAAPVRAQPTGRASLRFRLVMLLVGVLGYLSLSYEILWVRTYALASGGVAQSFPMMLGAFLAGIALGSWLAPRYCRDVSEPGHRAHLVALAYFVLLATLAGFLVIPVVSFLVWWIWYWPLTLPLVTLAAGLMGATLPLASHFSIPADELAGARLSRLYVANIVGAAAGSLVTGFVLLDDWSLGGVSVFLTLVGFAVAAALLVFARRGPRAVAGVVVAGIVVLVVGDPLLERVYDRLQRVEPDRPLVRVVETKSGVVTVDGDGQVFGGGIYDGYFNTDPVDNRNGIDRAYFLGALHPAPRRVLQIGLSTGSWAQVVVHHPAVESLTVVEINPGYLKLLDAYPAVASLRANPKVTVIIDDGRRWLVRNDVRFDAIVLNMTYHWRAHATGLLSSEFLELVRSRLAPGGVYFFNATGSFAVHRTAATVFPHALRMTSMMAVSNDPLRVDAARYDRILAGYRIDGKPVFAPGAEADRRKLVALASDFGTDGKSYLETRESVLARTEGHPLITDDNMATEWRKPLPNVLRDAWKHLTE